MSNDVIEVRGDLSPLPSSKTSILLFPTPRNMEEEAVAPSEVDRNQAFNNDGDARTNRANELAIAAWLIVNCAALTHMLLKVCNIL